MISCTRRIQFCAGHRVMGHENKCARPHGHNWVAFVHARAPQLDQVGRVIDFSVLKEKVGGWIDRWWDHGFICFYDDKEMLQALDVIEGAKIFVLPFNPTSENLARFLLETVCPNAMKGTGVQVFKVTIWETENCFSEASL